MTSANHANHAHPAHAAHPAPPSSVTPAAVEPTPGMRVLDLIVGYWKSCAVQVAARLSLAEQLGSAPKSVADLAKVTETDAPSLFRLMRMLASCGVFRERADGKFENTPLSEVLRADAEGSLRGFAIMMVDDYNLRAWGGLLASMKDGSVALDRVLGQPVFEWMQSHPEQAREFGEAMSSLSKSESPAIAEALDAKGVKKLMDVGGSHGALLAAILKSNPTLRGVVYDRPEVVENARKDVYARDPALAGRLEFAAGDFFQSVPAGADAVIMKYILHDWTDEQCTRILLHCRAALGAGGKLFVCDNVIPPGNDPHWGKLLDINMLALTGGRERTKDEFTKLFAAAGFRLTKVTPTRSPLSIVEGVVA